MPCPLAAPTYTKEKEKDRSAHTATKKPATTVTTFIINCKSEKRNDLHASRSEGNCKGASSRTKVSSPFTSRFKSSAAAKASATPNAYIASTNRTEPPKKLPASASQTGSFAEQEMKGRMRMTRRCTCLLSSPRVVRIAAAVQPKPNKSEKTALPVSPTRRNTPSVMNASADKKPLSSNKKSAKYRMASCGRKERSMPRQPDNACKKSAAAAAPPAAASRASAPPSCSATAVSMSDFSITPGMCAPNASQNTAASTRKKKGSAKRRLYISRTNRPSCRAPAS